MFSLGADDTVSNQGTISGGTRDGVYLVSGGAASNTSTTARIQGGTNGIYASDSAAVVSNMGTISGISGDGVFLTGGGSVTNSTISARIIGGTNGVAAGTTTAVVTNFGTISGTSGDGVSLATGGKVTNSGTGAVIYGGNNGVYATNTSVAVVNTGTITGHSGGGVYLDAGGRVTNNSTVALISGGGNYGVRVNGAAGTVTNLGTITGNYAGVDFLNGGTLANNGTAARIVGADWGAYFGASGGGVTVTNQGTISGTAGRGVSFGDGGSLTNTGTGALIYGAGYGIAATGQYLTLVNTGRISGHSGGGVYFGAGATLTNSATAQIDGAANGILANNNAIHVVNQGTIAGTTGVGVDVESGGTLTNSGTGALIYGTTYGIQAIVQPFTVVNYGKISAHSGVGVYLGAGGSVTNGTSAQIDGATDGILASNTALYVINRGTIAGTTVAGIDLGAGGTVTNSGTAALITGAKYGIEAPGGAVSVSNQGSIVGTGNYGLFLGHGGVVTNSAGAVIYGGFDAIYNQSGGALTLTNLGSITTGSDGLFGVNVQAGGVVLNTGTGASIAGEGGGLWAQNVAATVSNQGRIVGTNNLGVYLGAGGTVTNSGTAALISGALYGITIHSGAATVIDQGTISGANAAVKFADTIGNVLELYPGAKLSGVVRGAGGTATLVLGSAASAGTVSGISSEYVGFGAVDVDAGAHWTMSGSNTIAALSTLSVGAAATLTVPSKLVSLGQPTLEGSGTIVLSGTGSMEVGTNNNATAGEFLIDATRTVVTDGAVSLNNVLNRGVVTGLGNDGLHLGAGGTVNNALLAAHISGQDNGIAADGAATVKNQGTVTGTSGSGVYLGAGGSVTNTGAGAVISGGDGVEARGSAAAVANFGSIISTSGVGVYLGAGGSVTNSSTVSVIYGQYYGVNIWNDPANITNLGTIAGPREVGAYFAVGGSVTNSGTAALISGGVGVKAGSPAAVTNQGTITGGAGAGVWLQAGGTVIDSGTISGSVDAVLFGTGYANRLVVDPSAVFSGKADGGNTVHATAVSTLELASSASAGTLHGLGSHYVNFAQTTIDAGATWTLTGYNSLASGATLTNSGTLVLSGATLTDSGVLINSGGITLDPSTLTVGTLLGTGVVTVDAGGMLEAQGTVAGGETITFAGSNAELHLDTPDSVSGSVANVGLGDLIDLKGIAPGSVQYADGTLSFTGGSFAVSLNGTPAVQVVSSGDGAVFEVVGPVITGTASDQPVTDEATIDPFSGVAITDANAGQTETVTVTLSNAANGTLSTSGAGNVSDGVYTDTGTADQVTTALQDLVFTPTLDTGPLGHTVTTTFTIQAIDTAGATATDSTTSVVVSAARALVTLATFTGSSTGATPLGGLIADAAGDLFGTTSLGGGDSDGTVFEIAKSGGVYASTPATLVTFNGSNGALPQAGLITDAAGDLLGTTAGGGADGAGTVFEITLSSGSYSNSPTTLATFADTNNIGYRPVAGVIADTAGDLFGTVHFPSGANDGAVFEIANGTTTVTQVVGFTGGEDGGVPKGALLLDAAGDLFGTTNIGGAGGQGTVFEIANTATGYATTATPLVSFTGGDDGANPLGGLITDANGDLFGTTSNGGHDGDGTVFEIANTATGYATTATPLATFDGTGNGANPADTLIADAAGDLFGTTQNGGADGHGTVFEIANTATGYAISPITLGTFNGTGNGANPYGGLIADPAGDLFGTTQNGGASGDGTAFEVVSTGATFAPLITGTAANQAVTDQTTIDPFAEVTLTDGNSGQTETVTVTLSDAANGTLSELANGNFNNGVYTDVGTAAEITAALDGLVFIPTEGQVPLGQTVTTTFTIQDADTAGAIATDDTTSVVATAVCFCAGTLIRTPGGEAPVEKLAAGDHVVTLSGVARRIVWIGSGKVMVARGRRSAATPVIVRKGAIAENVPNRDLHVTKGHSFYLDDVLIPVEFLVNHRTILWDDWAQEVTIYHVELETHDILLANGAPAESYRDDGNRWLFQNANSSWDQAPSEPCAPILTGGPVVDAIWLRLLERAGPRTDLPLTDEPDLHLLVDGKQIDATAQRDSMFVFRLRGKPRSVRLRSRAAVPQELGLSRDPRCLGVAVRRLVLAEARRQRAIEAGAMSLTDGYHAFEASDGIRWTDGDAAVPTGLFAGMSGPGMLMVQLGGATRYVADGVVGRAA